MQTILRFATVTALAVLGLAALTFGYKLTRADIAADVYRDRLESLATDYETLRTQFNDAVQRAAVTELVVDDGSLSVRVRTVTGVVRDIETPYDPKGEIYVDYVLDDGRLWIRRLFDANTPPADGLVIDPLVDEVAWSTGNVSYGKAIYRSLDNGRWIVTVTGSGSLGLKRVPDDADVDLSKAPEVREYAAIADELDESVSKIGFNDVWSRIWGN